MTIPLNNAKSHLASAHASGSGTLVLMAGEGEFFGEPSPEAPIRVTVAARSTLSNGQVGPTSLRTIFRCEGRDGDTLTNLTPIEGTVDRNYGRLDPVANLITAGELTDISAGATAAVDALDAIAVKTTEIYEDPDWLTKIAASKVIGDIPQSQVENLIGDLADCAKTTSTYADPSWLTSLAGSKITGNISGNAGSITGSIAQSQVTNLTTDLAAKAALAGAAFTGAISAPRLDCTANNSGLWTSNSGTRIFTDGSTTWVLRATSSFAIQVNGTNYMQFDTGGGLRVYQAMRLIAVADNTAQSGAIWWSTNTADVLYAKTPSNVTRTVLFKETLTLPEMADANIPSGGLAWSTTEAGKLKARSPSGTLSTLN